MNSTDDHSGGRPARPISGAVTPWAAALLVCWLGSGCAAPRPATLQQLRTRAAFDLICPAHQVQLYPLDQRTQGVVGCGRRLTYVEQCATVHGEPVCSWMVDAPPAGQLYGQPRCSPAYAYGGGPAGGPYSSGPPRPAPLGGEPTAPPASEPVANEPAPAEPDAGPLAPPVPTSRDFGF